MEEDITSEIKKIVNFCRKNECESCIYLNKNGELCNIHNPSAWEV